MASVSSEWVPGVRMRGMMRLLFGGLSRVVGKSRIVAIGCDRRQISVEEQNHGRVARKPLSEPARVRNAGANQPRPQQLGLSDRRLRDRDDPGPQPPGARCNRLSSADIARWFER